MLPNVLGHRRPSSQFNKQKLLWRSSWNTLYVHVSKLSLGDPRIVLESASALQWSASVSGWQLLLSRSWSAPAGLLFLYLFSSTLGSQTPKDATLSDNALILMVVGFFLKLNAVDEILIIYSQLTHQSYLDRHPYQVFYDKVEFWLFSGLVRF